MRLEYETLDEFWPFYVSQHLHPVTRALHFAGTNIGLACLAASLFSNDPYWVPAGLAGSYGLAWIGHFFFEHNKPATFEYPWLSFRADFRMFAIMWRGGMDAEIARLKRAPARKPS